MNTIKPKKHTVIFNRLTDHGNTQIVVIDHTTGKPTLWQRIITKDSEAVPTLSASTSLALFQLCVDESECNVIVCEDGEVVKSEPPIEIRQYHYPASRQKKA